MGADANLYDVKLQTRWILQGMFDEPKMADLIASGAVEMKTFKDAYPEINGIKPGQYLFVPQFSSAPDFTRVDLSSSGDRSFTAVSSYTQQFPVIRDSSDQSWNRYDRLKSAESFDGSFEATVGNKWAKRLLGQIGRVLSGSCKASGDRTADFTGKTITMADVIAAKSLAGDQSENLTVMIAHSKVINDLLLDITTNQKYNALTATSIVDGRVKKILGLDYIIASDQMPKTAAGFSSTGDDVYESFILRGGMAGGVDGALFLGYQSELETESFVLPTKEVSQRYIRAYADYICAPRGYTFAATANPTDANLSDSSNWTEANEDKRNIGAVRLLTAGFGGTRVV